MPGSIPFPPIRLQTVVEVSKVDGSPIPGTLSYIVRTHDKEGLPTGGPWVVLWGPPCHPILPLGLLGHHVLPVPRVALVELFGYVPSPSK